MSRFYRVRKGSEAHKKLESFANKRQDGLDARDIAVILFDKNPTSFQNIRFANGVAFQYVNGAFFLEHCDCDVEPIVKGITRIQESEYIKATKEVQG